MRGSGQKTARESAPPRASGGRRRLEPTALVPTEVNGDGVEVNGDRVAVNEEQAQFGRLVAFRRQRLGMSQEELAAQMGIGLDGVVRIEQGEAPGPEMSGRLDRALRDEPQSGLDPNQVRELRTVLRELAPEHTVLLSSHALTEVEAVVSHVVVLARGRVVAEGSPAELRARAGEGASLEDAFAAITGARA